MAFKAPSKTERSEKIQARLKPIAKALRRADVQARLPDDLEQVSIYGVRDAKRNLSNLLNEASSGTVSFIEAGQGGTIALIAADVLAEIFESIEEERNITFGAALSALPYSAAELSPLELKGHGLTRGVSAKLSPQEAV